MYFNSEKETKKNMKRIVTLLLMTTLCLTMTAQGKLTLQARMQMMRQKAQMERNENAAHAKKQPATAQEQQRMTLVVSVADSNLAATVKQMKAAGAEVRSRLGRQVVINIPIDSVDVLQSIEGVQRIDKGHKGYKKSDVTRKETGVSLLNGPSLPANTTSYDGKGVTICLIDIGFDYQHPAFKDAEGRSRIKCVYLMGDEGGHKFTVNDPELGDITFPGSVYDTPELIATLVTDDMEEYHGTHTAGITAGCITPQGYGGMAPEADLVLIPHHELTSEEFADRNEDDFMELALAFVAAYADHSQQPVVLNTSANSHAGPHNGTSSVTKAIEEVSKHVIPVFSVGNEGGYPIHLYNKFTAAKPSVKTILLAIMEGKGEDEHKFSYKPFVHGYVRKGDMASFQLALKSIDITGCLTTVWSSEICTATPGCEPQMFHVSSADDPELAKHFDGDVFVGANQNDDGTLYLSAKVNGGSETLAYWELIVSGSEDTEIDLWDEMAGFGGVNHLKQPGYVDGDSYMSSGDWTSTERVISVGAYCSNELMRELDGTVTDTSNGSDDTEPFKQGDIAWFSSYGTSFNGVAQPVVCAPGVNIVSSVNHYNYDVDTTYDDTMQWNGYPYNSESGTSMSCPVVTGIIALWLQAKPDMTVDDVKDVLKHSSRTDSFTAADNEGRWGYGKIDAASGINYILNGTNAIHNVDYIATPTDAVYDLQGRRISHRPAPGLYIKNGRKVVIR